MKEVEVKYFVTNFTGLKKSLKKLGFKLVKESSYEDYYYTDKAYKFIKNETCLRLRKKREETLLTFKPKTVKDEDIKSKTEVETRVDFNSMHKVLLGLGYILAVNYKKSSDYYNKGKVTVSLDTVGGKKYVEIEVLAHKTKNAKKEIAEIVNDLKLTQLEKRNYRDIMMGYDRYSSKKL
ncbi:MAG: class IV adenylate cyclase [Nanoarchaeota archaeon]|nr:class IV adenylate cyclase [Nanoarchaeota archaeon]